MTAGGRFSPSGVPSDAQASSSRVARPIPPARLMASLTQIGPHICTTKVVAVMTLIWFSRQTVDQRTRVWLTLRALVQNPLILACLAGMAWARWMPPWPVALDNTLRMAAYFTLPFALISIGGSLTLSGLRERLGVATAATVLKIAALPVLGWWALRQLQVSGPDMLTGMLFFAMPASTAMYVLSAQLDSDADLSSAVIVLSTMVSFFSLSAVLLLFT